MNEKTEDLSVVKKQNEPSEVAKKAAEQIIEHCRGVSYIHTDKPHLEAFIQSAIDADRIERPQPYFNQQVKDYIDKRFPSDAAARVEPAQQDQNLRGETQTARGLQSEQTDRAQNIANMVIAYVEGGIRDGLNWRNGLADIIALRLRRLNRANASLGAAQQVSGKADNTEAVHSKPREETGE